MSAPNEERTRYNVGVYKLPYAERDLAHEVITPFDQRGFLDVMGADSHDDDLTFPVGAPATYSVELTDAEADRFRAASNLRYLEPDGVAYACAIPTAATLAYLQATFSGSDDWHGRDVPIAVCDAGTTAAVRAVRGWTLLGRRTFGTGTDPAPAEIWDDGSYHGCHTAAATVPAGGQFYDLLITGSNAIAPFSSMAASMVWAAARGVKIVSLAFGYPGSGSYDQAIRDAIDYCAARDVQVFCPAGNTGIFDNDPTVWYPASYCANYDNVHGIIQFDQATDTRYPTSCHSSLATGCAPGTNVATLTPAGVETTWTGTSAATSHVTLLCARGATGGHFTAKEVAAALRATLRDTGQPASEQGGGAFVLQPAIQYLLTTGAHEGPYPPAMPTPDPNPVSPRAVTRRHLTGVAVGTETTTVAALTGPGLPTWEIDTLQIVGGSSIDSLGRQWTVAKHPDGEKGWTNSPGVRTNRSDRTDAEGSYRSRSYRKERLITLSGSVLCPTPEIREQTEHELAALCDPVYGMHTYRRTTESYDLCATVELDDEPLIDVITIYRLDWSFRFAAPDPRKHDFRWQEPRTDPPQPGAPGAGLDDFGGGLDDTGGGLSDGTTPGAEPREAQVANYGTAPARPFFILRGPLTAPRIIRVETGETLRSTVDIDLGETVYVNCDEYTTRGVPAQSVISSTKGDVSSLWTVGVTWPEVAAQDVASFALDSSGPREAMTVALRSAYR